MLKRIIIVCMCLLFAITQSAFAGSRRAMSEKNESSNNEPHVKKETAFDRIPHKNPLIDYSREGYRKRLQDRYKSDKLAYIGIAIEGDIDRYYWALRTNPSPGLFRTTENEKMIRKSQAQEDKEWEEYKKTDEFMAATMESWDRQDELAGVLLVIGLALFLRNTPPLAEIPSSARFIRSIPRGLSADMEGLTVLDTELQNTLTVISPKYNRLNIEGSVFKGIRRFEEEGLRNVERTTVVK